MSNLAIHGGKPVRTEPYPAWPVHDERDIEVIVPAYTFQAIAAAPMAAGASPIIVDIDPETYCIDPKAVEAAITPQTKAVIPVYLGGANGRYGYFLSVRSAKPASKSLWLWLRCSL